MNGFKKAALLVLGSVLATQPQAKVTYPAEVHGRELASPVGARLGHVGIATSGMSDPSGMNYPADSIIEVLNEKPVGQINTVPDFKRRSPYWGSRWGIADRGVRGYNMLVEANHQRWWCPRYTYLPAYEPGEGIPTTGYIIKCGTWRCDNYVWWLFNTFGFSLVPSGQFNPAILFNSFPYVNDGRFIPEHTQNIVDNRTLADLTAEEINSMEFERFEVILENPQNNAVQPKYVEEFRIAKDKRVKDIIRGGMLDLISITSNDVRAPIKMISMYDKHESEEVKMKIVQNVMIFDQRHNREEKYIKESLPKVREFFEHLMRDKTLSRNINDDALRGFIDTHSSDEIIASKELVDFKLAHLPAHEISIMLKSALMFKSPELQRIYTGSVVTELREVSKSDLDSYLFGPLSLAYKAHPEFLTKESENLVSDYLIEVQFKYSTKGIVSDKEDFTRSTTAPYHAALSQALGIR